MVNALDWRFRYHHDMCDENLIHMLIISFQRVGS
jgi:hypothetical protein